jgi:hypothetical protein
MNQVAVHHVLQVSEGIDGGLHESGTEVDRSARESGPVGTGYRTSNEEGGN